MDGAQCKGPVFSQEGDRKGEERRGRGNGESEKRKKEFIKSIEPVTECIVMEIYEKGSVQEL